MKNSNQKNAGLLLAITLFTACSFPKKTDKIDEKSILTKITSMAELTPAKDSAYLVSKGYKIVNTKIEHMSEYDATFVKYRMTGSDDNYTIANVKDNIVNAMYITYNEDTYNQIMDEATKAGYVKKKGDDKESMYALGDERINVDNSVNVESKKPFHLISVSDLTVVENAIREARK